jgi:hypothetical protein
MLRHSLLLMVVVLPELAHAAGCATAAPTHRVAVLELYTSEGCSSCPPADRWLRALGPRDDLVLVAFHVDYWDRLGWRDPWSDPRFSARQHWRAGRTGARVVYTPDVVFEGRSRNDWARGWTPDGAPRDAPFDLDVRVAAVGGSRLDVAWSAPSAPRGSRAWLAVTQSGLTSLPNRGENRGRMLQHAHVARVFVAPLDSRAGSHALNLPADLDHAAARVQFVIEDSSDARPLHAASLPLAGCRRGD